MKNPDKFLSDSGNSGVYAAPDCVATLKKAAAVCEVAWMELDLKSVRDKAGFLAQCRSTFGFPSSFGHNWDALADSLQDMSWRAARGYVVHCRNGGAFSRRSPQDLATALEILEPTPAYWKTKNKVYLVLLDSETRGGREWANFPD